MFKVLIWVRVGFVFCALCLIHVYTCVCETACVSLFQLASSSSFFSSPLPLVSFFKCKGGTKCLCVCVWMFAAGMNFTRWNSCRERGEALTIFVFEHVNCFQGWGAAAKWLELHAMATISAIISRRELRFGMHVELRGTWNMFEEYFWICPWGPPHPPFCA